MWDPTPNLPHGYGGLLIMVAFVGSMLWIIWLDRRRGRFGGASEVSAAAQASLGQAARAMYVDPRRRLCDMVTPTAFDTRVLSLFESIEGNRVDIDAKLEDLRAYLKTGCTLFPRLKNKQKLRLVYGAMRWDLVRGRPDESDLGKRQLLANWGKLGDIAGTEGPPRKLPKIWIRPLVTDVAPKPS